jgi:phage replication O-like protein O
MDGRVARRASESGDPGRAHATRRVADLSRDFTKFPNGLVERICRERLPGEHLRVLHAVVRLTAGWSRATAEISGSGVSKLTGIRPKRCNEILAKLASRGFIARSATRGRRATVSLLDEPTPSRGYVGADEPTPSRGYPEAGGSPRAGVQPTPISGQEPTPGPGGLHRQERQTHRERPPAKLEEAVEGEVAEDEARAEAILSRLQDPAADRNELLRYVRSLPWHDVERRLAELEPGPGAADACRRAVHALAHELGLPLPPGTPRPRVGAPQAARAEARR